VVISEYELSVVALAMWLLDCPPEPNGQGRLFI
jgi:hypothetical protein